LAKEPELAKSINVVAMSGSIHKGYSNAPPRSAEFNVCGFDGEFIPGSQSLYSTLYNRAMKVTPLDTCGNFALDGLNYQRLRHSAAEGNKLVATVLDAYSDWEKQNPYNSFYPIAEPLEVESF